MMRIREHQKCIINNWLPSARSHTMSIMEAGAPLRQVDMPGLIGPFFETNPMRFPRRIRSIKEAQFHRRGIFRKQGKIHPFPIPRGSQRIGSARPDFHIISIRNGL